MNSQASRLPVHDRAVSLADAHALTPQIQSIVDAIEKMAFGTVAITIHDSKIVQVDVTEKKRFT